MIIIISGSPRGEHSYSRKYAEAIACATGNEYKIYEAGTWHIDYCKGCTKCLQKGHCVLHDDDFDTIVSDIRQADALIIASPVYCSHISGQLKTLFDRMMTELHVMPLIGKPAIALAVSGGTHGREVADYIAMILEFCGASVISSLACSYKAPKSETEKALIEAAEQFKKAMSPDFELPVSSRTRLWFNKMNFYHRYRLKIAEQFYLEAGESEVWKKQGYMKYKDIDELLRDK